MTELTQKEMSSRGGKTAAKRMTKKQRQERAKKAALAGVEKRRLTAKK